MNVPQSYLFKHYKTNSCIQYKFSIIKGLIISLENPY